MPVIRKNKRYGNRVLGVGVKVSNDTTATMNNNNDIIVGGSGSGKTGGYIYAMLKILRSGSMIVADTKSRLARMFRSSLGARGYRVFVLDFVNPEKSCKYNPLDYIRRNASGRYNESDIATLASALLPEDRIDSRDPFWVLSARNYLEFFIGYTLCALPEEDHNLYTVARLVRAFRKPDGEEGFMDWIEENPETLVASRFAQIKGCQASEKTSSSIYAYVDIALAPFQYEEFRSIFDPGCVTDGAGVLDIASIGKEKTVLFINVSDTNRSHDSLANIFYTQALQTLTSLADGNEDGKLAVPVRMILDDFASGTVIPNFDKIISVVRSRDIWLTLSIQSLSQLRSLYSHDQSISIINNCDTILCLGTNDIETAEFIGTRANKTPDVILSMDRNKEYILMAGHPAMLADKIPPYSYVDDEADKSGGSEP